MKDRSFAGILSCLMSFIVGIVLGALLVSYFASRASQYFKHEIVQREIDANECLGYVYLSSGDTLQAVAHFEEGIDLYKKKYPRGSDVEWNLWPLIVGSIYLQQDAETSRQIKASNVLKYYSLIAIAYKRAGKEEISEEIFEMASNDYKKLAGCDVSRETFREIGADTIGLWDKINYKNCEINMHIDRTEN